METDARTQRALTQIGAIAMPLKATTTRQATGLGCKIAHCLKNAGVECRFETKGSMFDTDPSGPTCGRKDEAEISRLCASHGTFVFRC